MYSYLIREATVVDGEGQPPFRADVAIEGERIAAIAPRIGGTADQQIQADGLVAAPGFIDIHTHTDATVFKHPLVESKAMQGVTVEVIGNCGIGTFPVHPERRKTLADYLKMHDFDLPEGGLDWNDLAQYANRLEKLGLGVNLVPLVSHGALRIAVMGAESRNPTPDELREMERLLAEALQQGAWGMSTGLIYPPGSFAKTEELISLAKVLARYGALYTSHIRGESSTLMQALDEAIRIGRESGARVEVSHLKAMGKDNWGRGREVLQKLELARQAGVDIAADQYPYEASSTSLSALVPQWAHAGGVAALLQRLSSPELGSKLRDGIIREMTIRGGPERIMVTNIFSDRNVGLSGRTLIQIAESWRCPAEEAVIRLLLEEEAAVGAIFFSMSEGDVTAILASDQVSVGSDGRGLNAMEDSGEATHPRSYGTFARILGHFVREKNSLPLASAVRKMTGLSAYRLGFADRGLLRPGFAADLVLFDPAAIADQANFIHPHEYARGIIHVWVNGRPLIQDGKFTGERPGRVLRKKNP